MSFTPLALPFAEAAGAAIPGLAGGGGPSLTSATTSSGPTPLNISVTPLNFGEIINPQIQGPPANGGAGFVPTPNTYSRLRNTIPASHIPTPDASSLQNGAGPRSSRARTLALFGLGAVAVYFVATRI